MPRDFLFGSDIDDSPHDPQQVNDWNTLRWGIGHGEAKQIQFKKGKESVLVLITSMTTGIIKTTLLWSEPRTQARQTTTPSAIIN
jgi:hypothetical protein